MALITDKIVLNPKTTGSLPSGSQGSLAYDSTLKELKAYGTSWRGIKESQHYTAGPNSWDSTVTWSGASDGYPVASGGYQVLTFNGSGSFTITGAPLICDVLLVAGGGGGGGRAGGGGGAGGFVFYKDVELSAGVKTVTVGAGGTAGASDNVGGSGGNTSVTGLTSAVGGGGGAGDGAVLATGGGSGGGGGYTGGSKHIPGTGTTNQGFAGGAGTSPYKCGGGGGAGEPGRWGGTPKGGAGHKEGHSLVYDFTANDGRVVKFDINGTETGYCGGGGGGGHSPMDARGMGGYGGGASGGNINAHDNGENGGNTQGGGGGGASSSGGGSNTGGTGGSGCVVVRWRSVP